MTAAALPGLAERRRLAIVPAFNEEGSLAAVIDEIRAFDPGFKIVVVDDGSSDRTSEIALSRGVHVATLPFNLGIGAAVQTGYRFALANDFDLAVQIDGDGQHDPAELPAILAPVLAGEADLVIGSRFLGEGAFHSSFVRRLGIRLFALTVSAIARQRLTDTTSGFRAVNRRGIALFAAGLATQGFRPVCAIYSTFLQRAYDQIMHDVALQSLPVLFAMDRGGLVGDDLVNGIVASRIARPDCERGFLLDGYPRTVPQAITFCALLKERGLPLPVVIHLDVPDEALVGRLTARRQ